MALRGLAFLILTMLAATVMVAQQRGSGAYLAEFSTLDPAEARHFVTGLMVVDHAAAGFPAPSGFREAYALHFPVAASLGALSLFHLVEAGWIGLIGAATPAVLLLPALMAALLVVSAGWATARAAGPLPGLAVGFVLSALPAVRRATMEVGLHLPLALFALLAVLAFARYLRRGGVADAALFALAGLGAALTAPAGAVLALVPPLGVLLAGRLRLLARPLFWLPVILIAAFAVPALLGGEGIALPPVAELTGGVEAARAVFGTLPLVLAGVGVPFAAWAGWRQRQGAEIMAAVAAAALALAALLAMGGGGDAPDGLLPLLAPLCMLAAFGALRLLGLVISGWPTLSGLVVALVLLLAAMPALLEPMRKSAIGMDDAAQAFLARDGAAPVLVVAADARDEAALTAAVAQRDRAQDARAARSFVVSAGRLPEATGAALLAALDGIGASALVVEATDAARAIPANRAVAALPAAFPDRFRRVGTFPRADGKGQVELYAITGAPPPADPAAAIRRLGASAF